MEQEIFNTRTLTFNTPSGHIVTIREQNGADDDVLSNPVDAATLMNLSKFVSGIIVKCDYEGNSNGKISVKQAHELPALDRYCILFNSRIFSLGDTMEFEYNWGENGGKVNYEQDLKEYLFDYSTTPSEEELDSKPNAIPFYPMGKQFKDIPFTTTSGKELMFDILSAEGESWASNLPAEKQTKNSVFMARNLRLKVNDKFEKVTNFSLFSVKDMRDIRAFVLGNDPTFLGLTTIENPVTHEKVDVSVVMFQDFFYPGEI